jgi:hypothetical protein
LNPHHFCQEPRSYDMHVELVPRPLGWGAIRKSEDDITKGSRDMDNKMEGAAFKENENCNIARGLGGIYLSGKALDKLRKGNERNNKL